MRSIKAGNKSKFAQFAIIIISVIAVLVLSLRFALKVEKIKYEVPKGVFLYDEEYNSIKLTEDGIITKKWDDKYYLKIPSESEEYKLGNEAVAYDSLRHKIDLYGSIYQVDLNGDVEKLVKNSKIQDISEDKFYKLADRKYLVVGDSIQNDKGNLNTKHYLIIVLDKAGNTLLLNNEINLKTINQMTIKTSSFEFDIANEKLISDEREIDLKKIIGSTNEYKPKEEIKVADNSENNNNGGDASGNGNGNTGGGNYYTNSNVNNNSNNQTNINVDSLGGNTENKTPLLKSVSLKSVFVTATYMDIEYSISDPENKYETVYVLVEGIFDGSETSEKISLDKNSTMYRLTGLTPNSGYKVTMKYKEITADANIVEGIEDMLNVRTIKPEIKLAITKITSNEIYFNLKMDPNYILDSYTIKLYSSSYSSYSYTGKSVTVNIANKDDVINMANIEKSTSLEGWTGSISHDMSLVSSPVLLKLENAVYNKEAVDLGIEAKAYK